MTPTTTYGNRPSNGRFGAPSIRANSHQLDDRFPVLGFTVNSGGKRYYEVLLATDPRLFHPSEAHQRSRSNFYSSRQDSGLIAADSELYTAPSSVLQQFAGASAIYYTVLGYDNPQLEGAEPAADPELLAQQAPSVTLSAGFSGRTLARVLGVAASDLRRVREEDHPHNGYANGHRGALDFETASALEDLGEGEDGYGISAAWEQHEHQPGEADTEDPLAPLSAGLEEDRGGCADLSPGARASQDESGYDGDSYGLESTFPAGAHAPALLEDEDYVDEGQAAAARSAGEDGYDDGFGRMNAAGVEQSYGGVAAEAWDEPQAAAADVALTGDAKRNIMRAVSENESASFANRYEAINPRSGPPTGLVYGIVQFTQASGSLGLLLDAMKRADRARLEEVFGATSGQLLDTLKAPVTGSTPAGGRNARVQPVPPATGAEAVDLWQSPWKERFIRAASKDLFGPGARQLFNDVQDEMGVQLYLDPMLPMARWLALNEDRLLGVVMDRAVHMGLGGARRWIMRKVLEPRIRRRSTPLSGPSVTRCIISGGKRRPHQPPIRFRLCSTRKRPGAWTRCGRTGWTRLGTIRTSGASTTFRPAW